MDELLDQICERTGMTREQAQGAVDVILDLLKQRLPPPLGDQVADMVRTGSAGNAGGLLGGLGGLLGGRE